MLLKDKYNLGDLKTNNLTLKKYTLANFPDAKNNFVGFNSYIGIEVEIENLKVYEADYLPNFMDFWNITKDGSLRNTGAELVSVPLRGINIAGALGYLDHFLTKIYPGHDFSHRCGIHVHVNCRNLTVRQVNNIIYVYLCLENVLFDQFVKNERAGNSFCMPVTDVFVGKRYHACKYQALNRKCLSELGTLEFRHLRGTRDIVQIRKWIKIITNLVKYASNKTYEEIFETIQNLNTISNYEQFVREVIGPNDFVKLQESMERDIFIAKSVLHRDLT
jgi:Putative amidoligase enzyme